MDDLFEPRPNKYDNFFEQTEDELIRFAETQLDTPLFILANCPEVVEIVDNTFEKLKSNNYSEYEQQTMIEDAKMACKILSRKFDEAGGDIFFSPNFVRQDGVSPRFQKMEIPKTLPKLKPLKGIPKTPSLYSLSSNNPDQYSTDTFDKSSRGYDIDKNAELNFFRDLGQGRKNNNNNGESKKSQNSNNKLKNKQSLRPINKNVSNEVEADSLDDLDFDTSVDEDQEQRSSSTSNKINTLLLPEPPTDFRASMSSLPINSTPSRNSILKGSSSNLDKQKSYSDSTIFRKKKVVFDRQESVELNDINVDFDFSPQKLENIEDNHNNSINRSDITAITETSRQSDSDEEGEKENENEEDEIEKEAQQNENREDHQVENDDHFQLKKTNITNQYAQKLEDHLTETMAKYDQNCLDFENQQKESFEKFKTELLKKYQEQMEDFESDVIEKHEKKKKEIIGTYDLKFQSIKNDLENELDRKNKKKQRDLCDLSEKYEEMLRESREKEENSYNEKIEIMKMKFARDLKTSETKLNDDYNLELQKAKEVKNLEIAAEITKIEQTLKANRKETVDLQKNHEAEVDELKNIHNNLMIPDLIAKNQIALEKLKEKLHQKLENQEIENQKIFDERRKLLDSANELKLSNLNAEYNLKSQTVKSEIFKMNQQICDCTLEKEKYEKEKLEFIGKREKLLAALEKKKKEMDSKLCTEILSVSSRFDKLKRDYRDHEVKFERLKAEIRKKEQIFEKWEENLKSMRRERESYNLLNSSVSTKVIVRSHDDSKTENTNQTPQYFQTNLRLPKDLQDDPTLLKVCDLIQEHRKSVNAVCNQ